MAIVRPSLIALSMIASVQPLAAAEKEFQEDYEVQSGESLSEILHKRGIASEELYSNGWLLKNQKLNPHVNDWNRLRVGEKLRLVIPAYLSETVETAVSPNLTPPITEEPTIPPHVLPPPVLEAPPEPSAQTETPKDEAPGVESLSDPSTQELSLSQSLIIQQSVTRLDFEHRRSDFPTIHLIAETSQKSRLNSDVGDIEIDWSRASVGIKTIYELDLAKGYFELALGYSHFDARVPSRNSLGQTLPSHSKSKNGFGALGLGLQSEVFSRKIDLSANYEIHSDKDDLDLKRMTVLTKVDLYRWDVKNPVSFFAFGNYQNLRFKSATEGTFVVRTVESKLNLYYFGLGLSVFWP